MEIPAPPKNTVIEEKGIRSASEADYRTGMIRGWNMVLIQTQAQAKAHISVKKLTGHISECQVLDSNGLQFFYKTG